MNLGERIAAWRRYHGWSLRNVANRVEVTHAAVLAWEGGGGISGHRLKRLAVELAGSEERFWGPIPEAIAS